MPAWLAQLLQAVANRRGFPLPVGFPEPVPEGKDAGVIGVGFCGDVGMVDPVHVRRDDQAPHPAVQSLGHADVAVVEDDDRCQADFIDQEITKPDP